MTAVLPLDRRARPLRDLRVSVIETCNFRCPYCMPADATPDETALDRARRLSFEQIESAVRAFVALGVRKVRLTGGEPLLRKHLPDLVARLVAVPGIDDLALTTNGSLLSGQAAGLRAAGLKRLTISLD
ncbi:MAG: radical SAM protein, partial [Arenimonas sp.]